MSVTSTVMKGSVPSAEAVTDGYPEGLKGPALASASFSAAWTAGAVGMICANAVASSAPLTAEPPLTAEDPLMMSRDVAWYVGVVNFVAAAAPPTQAIITRVMRIQRRRSMWM